MIDPLSANERDAIGAADRLVVGLGAALAATLPTLALVLVWPETLGRSIADPSPAGRRGPVLGAGLFFVLAIVLLSLLAYAANPDAGGLAIQIGSSVSAAGRAASPLPAILAGLLPVFVGVVVWSVVVYLTGLAFRLRDWSFERALRTMLYAVVGMVCVMVAAEEVAKLMGGNPNDLFGYTLPVAGLFLGQFVFRSRRVGDPALRLFGAATTIGLLTAALGFVL